MSVKDYMTGRLSVEQVRESIAEHQSDYQELVTMAIVPQLLHLLKQMHAVHPSKQAQLAIQDIESVQIHMADLTHNGAKTPLAEIPLEDSEDEDDFSFGEEQQLEFADEEETNS